jgi:hypothetical protein
MEMKTIIKTVKGILAGDGNAYDRMNAVQGGIGLPEWISEIVKYCKDNKITYQTLEAEAEKDPLWGLINFHAERNPELP